MNNKLNPFMYRLQPGKRRALLSVLSFLTFRCIDFVRQVEQKVEIRIRCRIVEQLNAADLVVLRDPENLAAAQACGDVPNAIISADSAELLEAEAWENIQLSAGTVDQCEFDHIQSELDRLIDSRAEFEEVSVAVHEMLLHRLDEAKGRLARLLQG